MNEIRFYDSWEDSVAERCKPLSSLIHGGHVSASVLPERLTPHFKKHTKKWGWKTGFWCQKIRATLDRRWCDSCWRPKPCRRTSDAGNHPCSWSLASVNENHKEMLKSWKLGLNVAPFFCLSGPEDWAARDPHFVCYFPMFSGPCPCRHFLAQCRTETLLDPNPFLLPREPKWLWFWKIWYVWTHKKGDWPSRIESICVPLICLPCTIVASHTTPGQKWLAAATISP